MWTETQWPLFICTDHNITKLGRLEGQYMYKGSAEKKWLQMPIIKGILICQYD